MVTNAGGGYSRWQDLAVTRWREDATRDNWGTFCYLRDVDERRVLVDRAPADAASAPSSYEAIFSQGRAEFRRRDDDIDTHTEIGVSPEDDIELRRVTHHQPRPRRARTIELTSYAEVVLAPPAADAAAPGVQQPVRADRARPRRGRRSSARAGRARPRSGRRGCST